MAFACKNAGKAPKSCGFVHDTKLPAEIDSANKQMQFECNSLTKLGNNSVSEWRTLNQLWRILF